MKKIISAFIPKNNVCFHSTSKRSPQFQIFCVKLYSSTPYGLLKQHYLSGRNEQREKKL